MSKLAERYGPWAVVTGASAGIGAEFALRVAERGINVVLVARRRNRLEELASAIEDMYRVEARVAPADLTSRDVIEVLQPAIGDIEIGLLINCAGFGSSGPFLDIDRSIQESMINLNCRAPLLLTHEIVQGMRERGRGGVIFVSSVNGFCAARGMANYNATKAYDLLFAEGLAEELRPYGVDVQALCPGATMTEFHQVAGLDMGKVGPLAPLIYVSAASVVATSLRTLGRRVTVVPGVLNKLMVLTMRLAPRRVSTWIFGSLLSRFAAGD
ncbi:MAG: SDR family oxidoreductase [Deltaproteobacteria bacterium]|nr:MAG: SDR family oxidoreductase [Deltaproteobacteria bacterium]UCF47274.1 MAG: SDR family oxidoreductase [Myxococcales bacterium]